MLPFDYNGSVCREMDTLMYQSSMAWHIQNMPGLRPSYKVVYDTAPWLRDMYVFQPLVEMVCESRNDCVDSR